MQYAKAAREITDYVSKENIHFPSGERIREKYEKFQETYSPKILSDLKDSEVLDYIFIHDQDDNNLCYALEFDNIYVVFGSIGGGSSFKYQLYKSKDGKWIWGNSYKNKKEISEEEAIAKGKEIADALVKCCNIIMESSLKTPKEYGDLEDKLNDVLGEVNLKSTSGWVHKYFHMIFPDKFLTVHSDKWRNYILEKLNVDSNHSSYFNEGQIISIINKTDLQTNEFYTAFVKKYGEPTNKTASDAKQIWLLSPGENAKLWDDFKENNVIAIGWGKIGNLNSYSTSKEIANALKKAYDYKSNPTTSAKTLYDFSREMKVGDTVIIKTGTNRILGVGKITSDYKYSEILEYDDNYFNMREVEWLKLGEWESNSSLPIKTLTNITNAKGKALLDLIGLPAAKDEYGKAEFLSEVLFLEENYDELVELLKRKKNLILQGAPGVGKTYIAKRLAHSMMGERNNDRVELIQFHQSYSYEDFIQGYRPSKNGFELENGVFYNFCKKAEKDPENGYYFIIDEINRGNISKIFGELMMLIEEDKRGEEFAINLTYGKEKFHVPKNVYIIGMMNTADRSLAMIDYALRRRFVFYTIEPLFDDDSEHGDILKSHLIHRTMSNSLASDIIEKFTILNEEIAEDPDLGPGFKIGHSYFLGKGVYDENWYNSIIQFEIAPILNEYWFDDAEKAMEKIEFLTNNAEYND